MMRSLLGLMALTTVTAVTALPASAEDHAVGARLGLLGIGVEYSYRLNDRILIRGGLNGSGYSFDETESGIAYAFDLDFDSLSVGVDFHPLKNAFRVSAGLLQNDSGLTAIGIAAQSFTIGDTIYQPADVGTLSGRIGFDGTAPFFAVGWDWLREKKVGFALDIGILDQGPPTVVLSASGPIASDPDFASDLAAERAELQQSLDDLDIYPYAMFGVVFRF
jgi:hypothetical protein